MKPSTRRQTHYGRKLGRVRAFPFFASRVAPALCLVACAAAVISMAAYRADGYVLRTIGTNLTAHLSRPDQQALALNHWIHAHLPTARNRSFFGWSRLRATPLQVLDFGGDCADKSRLLSAMLREIGIPATMALLFDPKTGNPTHTIVEARTGENEYMVLDPSFDLSFPNAANDGYLGLLDLRRDPGALHRRLTKLQSTNTWPALCFFYPESYAPYDHASTINWKKNSVTSFVGAALFAWAGDDMYHWARPVPLEEPKLLIGLMSLVLAGAALLAWLFGRTTVRRPRRTRVYGADTPAGSQITSTALKTGPSVQHSR